jgi:general secretion pathway protein A
MYEEFFGLTEKPFSLTPDPKYVFYSEQYRSALDQLLFGLSEREGFLLLTGMVGTGKTTLSRELLHHLNPRKFRTALVFNPFLSGAEMLETLLTEFGCTHPPHSNRKELLERLNRFLLSQLIEGRTCVAVFDEAQHLSPELLEQMRVLSNLETEHDKLLQIVLIGQPELLDRISNPSLAQLDQRVSIRCTLGNLSREDTERYIYHRLNTAGAQGRIQFSRGAIGRIYKQSEGGPRLINLICDRAVLAAYVERVHEIGRSHVEQAVQSLRGDARSGGRPPSLVRSRRNWRYALPATLAAVVALGAAWFTAVMP